MAIDQLLPSNTSSKVHQIYKVRYKIEPNRKIRLYENQDLLLRN